MELHIYRDGSHDRIVKDATKQDILYTIRSPCAWFSSPPKPVFHGKEQIATINRSGYMYPTYIIHLESNSFRSIPCSLTIRPPGVFNSKSKFEYMGREYVWESDKELSCEGKVIAIFERKIAWTKKGVLRIYGEQQKMIDVIVTTAIAMQYRWEESRNRRRRGAVSSGGP